MKGLILLISLAYILHGGCSRPTYPGSHGGYGGYAPVGYHGPLAKTVVLKSGHIADTPEVSAAKHLHYSAIAKAKSAAAAHGYGGNDGSYSSGASYDGSYGGGSGIYGSGAGYGGSYKGGFGSYSSGTGYDGSYGGVYGSYGSGGGYSSSYEGGYGSYDSGAGYGGYDAKQAPVGYHGPLAKVVVLKSGHIADTPEVSAAKHQHFAAIEKARSQAAAHGYYGGDDGSYKSDGGYSGAYSSGGGYGGAHASDGGYGGSQGFDGGYDGSYSSGGSYDGAYSSGVGYDGSYSSGGGYASSSGYAGSYKYSGPLAYPKVLPSGQLADTHDVAAAKHAHLNALAVTASQHAQKWANNYHH